MFLHHWTDCLENGGHQRWDRYRSAPAKVWSDFEFWSVKFSKSDETTPNPAWDNPDQPPNCHNWVSEGPENDAERSMGTWDRLGPPKTLLRPVWWRIPWFTFPKDFIDYEKCRRNVQNRPMPKPKYTPANLPALRKPFPWPDLNFEANRPNGAV